jgi:hypothetical protein
MEITCPSGLIGRVRNIKGHELAALAEQADGDSTPIDSIATIVGGCWQETVDPGPSRIIQAGDAKPSWGRVLSGDIIYSLLRLRASSVKTPDSDPGPWGPGDPYHFDVQCQACHKRYGWELLLSELKVKTLPDESKQIIEQSGNFTAVVGGRKYTFQLQTPELDEPITKLRRQQKRSATSIIDTLVAQTIGVEGVNAKDIKRRWAHIVDLDAFELRELQDAYEAADCGVDTEIQTKCTHAGCRYIQDLQLPFGRDFFRPRKPPPELESSEEEDEQSQATPT